MDGLRGPTFPSAGRRSSLCAKDGDAGWKDRAGSWNGPLSLNPDGLQSAARNSSVGTDRVELGCGFMTGLLWVERAGSLVPGALACKREAAATQAWRLFCGGDASVALYACRYFHLLPVATALLPPPRSTG